MLQVGQTFGYKASGCLPARISSRNPAITGAARLLNVHMIAQTRAIMMFFRSAHTSPLIYWLSTADLRPWPKGLKLHASQMSQTCTLAWSFSIDVSRVNCACKGSQRADTILLHDTRSVQHCQLAPARK